MFPMTVLQMKCLEYWPNAVDETLEFGDLQLVLVSDDQWPDYYIRNVRITKFQVSLDMCMWILLCDLYKKAKNSNRHERHTDCRLHKHMQLEKAICFLCKYI